MANGPLSKRIFRLRNLLVATAALSVWLTAPDDTFAASVVIGAIGDFGGAVLGAAQASNELAVANLVKRWDPDFLITMGDNNYPDGSAANMDPNIGQFYHEYISPYVGTYGAGASSNRFFPCLGNHDWVSSGQPYLNYFTLPGNERYYSYRYGPVELFVLNSNPDVDGTSSTSVQGRWLQSQLGSSTARWKLVYFHHPPYSADVGGTASTTFRWPFFTWGASVVLSGHDHIYARIFTNNLYYFINGLGGDSIGSLGSQSAAQVRYNGDYGAQRIEATETNLVFHFLSRNNVIVDTFVLGAAIWSPFILSPPLSQTTLAGRNVSFNVLAAGGAGLRYQWQLNSTNILNATNSTLLLTNVQLANAGSYAVVVSNSTNSTRSKTAQLSVVQHPIITQQPLSVTANSGTTVTLHVQAEGSGPLRYQWFFNAASMPVATSSSLILTNVQLEHAGYYTVLVTDNNGSLLSDAARLTVWARPTILLQPPATQTVAVGATATFSIAAAGTLPLSYGWRFNGRVITNIILNQYTCFWTLHNVQLTNAGVYRVGITNRAGTALDGLSSNAVLTVLADRDGDRMPDDWELANGFNPDDPLDGGLDADQDKQSNAQEFIAGTDPRSSESVLKVEGISLQSGILRLQFVARSNKTYTLQFIGRFASNNWERLAEFPAMLTNRTVEICDPLPFTAGDNRFYRLVTPRLP